MNAFRLSNTAWQINEYGFPQHSSGYEKLKYLLNYAVLAPSSHNTQPWKFAVEDQEIHVQVDKSRWLRVADADQRELFISIGCALENLLVAATYFGYSYRVTYFPDHQDDSRVASVHFVAEGKTPSLTDSELFYAIALRHTNRHVYARQAVSERDMARLHSCVNAPDVYLHMTDDAGIKRQVDRLLVQADVRQFADPKYREELAYWIGQGAFGHSWLIARIGQMAVTYLNMGSSVPEQDSEVLTGAPVLAVLSTRRDDHLAHVKVGQTFEQMALNATILNMGIQPMNQIVQIREIRAEIAALIPQADVFPQFTFRLGYATPEVEHTPRQQLESVLT
jgi:nitroreductase